MKIWRKKTTYFYTGVFFLFFGLISKKSCFFFKLKYSRFTFCISFNCTAKWFRERYIYKIFFHIPFPYVLLQNIECSSLCYRVGPCCIYFRSGCVCLCVCKEREGGRKKKKELFYCIYCKYFSSSLKDLGFYHMGVVIAVPEHYKVRGVIFQNA